MKKKIFIIGIIILFLGLITSYLDSARVRNSKEPKYVIKFISNDEKKITYLGLGYKVIRYVSVSPNEPYKNNLGVKYGSWFMNYELPKDILYAKGINKEDIIGANDLLFSISIGDNQINCIPVQLNIFDNGKYILYTSYESCKPNTNCNLMLKYSNPIEGKYNYDVIKIIQNSQIADNISFTEDNLPEFEIYTGNSEKIYHLITDSKNKYLDEFLKQINVDLEKCAEPNYN